MKPIIVFLFVLFSAVGYTQITGDIISDGRKIETGIEYTMKGTQAGIMVFSISVNMDGKVSACTLIKEESTIISTPSMIKAKNRILTGLTFEKGYHFPEFHEGKVTIEFVL
ncbi:MAG: hypothetical protein IPM74_05120 [Crocinitomicaceae bacterium]|nr:hypothetical protein [Crocinitomicaceae bacterium]MBK8925285.1 hypothetical protein [Crocinitomicaceae bacterium]